jgi:ABC-type uncharacterized transport system substrate-binding protein
MNRKLIAVLVLLLVAVLGIVLMQCMKKHSPSRPSPSPAVAKASPATQPSINKYAGKRILHIDSYHEGYEWSDRLTKGIVDTLKGTGVVYRDYKMDCKRNENEEFQKKAALRAKAVIEEFKPDVIIASDDNAFKYLIMPYYKDAALPIVFSGINWDASIYGVPYKNTTGMIEIAYIGELVTYLKGYSKGNRIGFLSSETLTAHKNANAFKKYVGLTFVEQVHVKTFEEWKKAFKELQTQADILILENNAGISEWNNDQARKFVEENIKIPTGAINPWITNYALIGVMEIPEEHGEWPAQTALRILDGAMPSAIPMVKSKKGDLVLNLRLAEKMGVVFAPSLLRNAVIIDKEK